jgi:DNA-binding CsgD family transcriptional regulator
MNARVQIHGEEVIGYPGQNLTDSELFVLVKTAEGFPTPVIAQELNIDDTSMRMVERNILSKLGAKNKAHMITRGFTLGVLVPQALCLMLCVIAALEVDTDFNRPRSQRRSRTLTEHSRTVRTSLASAGGPPSRYFAHA